MDLRRRDYIVIITTTLHHNDSASMECDANYDAEVQNVKHETEAALAATFEILFGQRLKFCLETSIQT